jgi:endonuclease-3 related protein
MELLGVKGIGPETADSILLYALNKPVFVVDAYTRRIMACQGTVANDATYDDIQSLFVKNLKKSAALFNEYHALLVEHAKRVCRRRPICSRCILKKDSR